MKQELMKLKNDEMQEKWKLCISSTCYAYRKVEVFKGLIDDLYDIIRQFLNSLAEVFKPVIESLNIVFDELRDFIEERKDFIMYMKNYPQSYPPYVDNLKLNSKGFPRPVMCHARSRC